MTLTHLDLILTMNPISLCSDWSWQGVPHTQIEIDDVDLREVDAAWFRSRIGVVSQDPRLFSMTIRENIAYGLQQVCSCLQARCELVSL